jgi:hypothetical protein
MRIRTIATSVATAAVLLAASATTASAATGSGPHTAYAATGTLELVVGTSVFGQARLAGIGMYGLSSVRVGMGDDGSLGSIFPVNATDRAGDALTDGEAGGAVWFGPTGKRLDLNSPSFLRHAGKGTVTARLFSGDADLGRVTLFDVSGGKTTPGDHGYLLSGGRMTLHAGADTLLNTALGVTLFTPGMRVGSLDVDVE